MPTPSPMRMQSWEVNEAMLTELDSMLTTDRPETRAMAVPSSGSSAGRTAPKNSSSTTSAAATPMRVLEEEAGLVDAATSPTTSTWRRAEFGERAVLTNVVASAAGTLLASTVKFSRQDPLAGRAWCCGSSARDGCEASQTALRLTSVRSSPDRAAGRTAALRRVPRALDVDVVLAVAAFGALIADPLLLGKVTGLTPAIVVLSLMAAVPLVARRRYPLAVLAAEVPLLLACLVVAHPNRAAVGISMLLVFTVGLEGGRARSLVVAGVMALLVTVAVALTGKRDGPIDFVAYTSLVLGALLAGETLRARQALQRAVAQEAVRASEAAARHRFDAERLALAHELHDVVGHALVAVNVRAAAAVRRARKGGAADGLSALDEIASVSAEALTELRTTLKALRAGQDGRAPLHPAQDLAGLASLIAGVQEAGLSVELEVTGTPASLPAPVGHAGYRIIQEGLTNVLRHSTARRARVRVEAGDHGVLIEVVDEGEPHARASQAASHGLAGMRERAATLGGSCEAGPVNGIGWRVRAEIPVAGVGGGAA